MVAMTSTTASGAQALACAVAVLGDDTPAAVAIGLAGLGAEDGERAADVLTAAGVLAPRRPLRFAQPAMRAGLYACLPPGVRAIAHRRAVRILTEAGADPLAVVRHACAVEPSRDPFVAAALATAGRHALAAGATREASLLLERAVAEPPPEEQRAGLRALLGHALTLLGDPRAPALTSQALATAEPHDRPRIAAELVDALWLSGRADAALALMREIAGVEPQGLAAALAARDGSLPAPEIARLARAGIDGSTAFERCLATAALIACDELEAARAGLHSLARLAASRGADAEGALLARLRGRLEALECGRPDPAPAAPRARSGDRALAGLDRRRGGDQALWNAQRAGCRGARVRRPQVARASGGARPWLASAGAARARAACVWPCEAPGGLPQGRPRRAARGAGPRRSGSGRTTSPGRRRRSCAWPARARGVSCSRARSR